MIQKKASPNFVGLLAAALLFFSMAGCGGQAELSQNSTRVAAKTVGAGETWIVNETTYLDQWFQVDGDRNVIPEPSDPGGRVHSHGSRRSPSGHDGGRD